MKACPAERNRTAWENLPQNRDVSAHAELLKQTLIPGNGMGVLYLHRYVIVYFPELYTGD